MAIDLGESIGLFAAGIAAGICGTVAGLASLASFPALLAVGLSPVSANVTNTVALVGNALGSAVGARPELAGQSARIRSFGVLTVLGGVLGATLLLATPSEGFQKVVPFLIGGSALLVLARPRIQAMVAARRAVPAAPGAGGAAEILERRTAVRASWVSRLTIFALGTYGGYFGAGAGVMMIALLATITGDVLVRVNALKNVLLGMANTVAAIGFIIFGPVVFAAAIPLGIGCILGGYIGPHIARRLPAPVLRGIIAIAGMFLAIKLGIDAYS